MKNRLLISEEEKNRIINLHKKQILKETPRSNAKLIREQEDKEIERLLALLDPNDPDPIKWQDIVNKIEAMGEDVITYIRKMKDKELAKKFGRWLKNNFNKVKFQQAADTVVSFFKNLGKKKPIVTPTETPQPTPQPTPTPTEDPNAWKEDYDKQKEWLLSQGFTEENFQMFEKNGTYMSKLFDYVYYEPVTSYDSITIRNVPKTIENYRELIKSLGFVPLVYEMDEFKKIFSIKERLADDVKEYLKMYIKIMTGEDYNYKIENVQINYKTRILSWEAPDINDDNFVTLMKIGFKNNKTGQVVEPKRERLGAFPLINIKYRRLRNIDLYTFKWLFDPETVQYEDYENEESMQDDFDYVRSWWYENGKYKFENDNGVIWSVDKDGKRYRKNEENQLKFVKDAVTQDILKLENNIKKYFKEEDLEKMLQKLENLKNEARGLKLYE